jgi:hypothetical protein
MGSDHLSSVKTSLKDVFREIYDLTGLAKFKASIEIIDNLLLKCQKVVICALHASFLT